MPSDVRLGAAVVLSPRSAAFGNTFPVVAAVYMGIVNASDPSLSKLGDRSRPFTPVRKILQISAPSGCNRSLSFE
jgi:hypothetical protein